MMGVLNLLTVVLAAAAASGSPEVLREISWASTAPEAGEVILADGENKFAHLRVANDTGSPITLTVLTIEEPSVGDSAYAIQGQVRYENVQGKAYLETLNYFAGPAPSFARTLASSGPMRDLEGSSPWRRFVLPMQIGPSAKKGPSKIEFNVVLPGKGTVELGPVQLVQSPNIAQAMTTSAWWSEPTSGLVYGIGGSLMGLCGGVIGALAGMGRARRLILPMMRTSAALGGVVALFGLVALLSGQPFYIYFFALFFGIDICVIMLVLAPVVRRRFAESDLRRMESHDVSPSGLDSPIS